MKLHKGNKAYSHHVFGKSRVSKKTVKRNGFHIKKVSFSYFGQNHENAVLLMVLTDFVILVVRSHFGPAHEHEK